MNKLATLETLLHPQAAGQDAGVSAHIEGKARIMVAGEFSAGKTQLVNAILGEQVLPSAVTSTSMPPMWISHGAHAPFLVDIEENRHDFPTVAEMIGAIGQVDMAAIKYCQIFHESAVLEHFDLIDTPGNSDPNIPAECWERMVEYADMIVWCTNSVQAWRQTEKAAWLEIPEAIRQRSLLVLSHADRLQDDIARDKVLRRVTREAGEYFSAIRMASFVRADEVQNVVQDLLAAAAKIQEFIGGPGTEVALETSLPAGNAFDDEEAPGEEVAWVMPRHILTRPEETARAEEASPAGERNVIDATEEFLSRSSRVETPAAEPEMIDDGYGPNAFDAYDAALEAPEKALVREVTSTEEEAATVGRLRLDSSLRVVPFQPASPAVDTTDTVDLAAQDSVREEIDNLFADELPEPEILLSALAELVSTPRGDALAADNSEIPHAATQPEVKTLTETEEARDILTSISEVDEFLAEISIKSAMEIGDFEAAPVAELAEAGDESQDSTFAADETGQIEHNADPVLSFDEHANDDSLEFKEPADAFVEADSALLAVAPAEIDGVDDPAIEDTQVVEEDLLAEAADMLEEVATATVWPEALPKADEQPAAELTDKTPADAGQEITSSDVAAAEAMVETAETAEPTAVIASEQRAPHTTPAAAPFFGPARMMWAELTADIDTNDPDAILDAVESLVDRLDYTWAMSFVAARKAPSTRPGDVKRHRSGADQDQE